MKAYIDNVAIEVTEKCNLNCAHCLRGKKSDKEISYEVIDAFLDQVIAINLLNICGAEPTLAVDKIRYLFEGIIKRNIILKGVILTTNGTVYDEKLTILFDTIKTYINDPEAPVWIDISCDEYHEAEIREKNLVVSQEYMHNRHFHYYRFLDYPIINEGNARHLPPNLNADLEKTDMVILPKDFYYIAGPLVTINCNGTITEDNASFENQETKYNYGNILHDNLYECLIRNGAKEVKKLRRFNRLNEKSKKKFLGISH